jgi:HlyD family secretion protein
MKKLLILLVLAAVAAAAWHFGGPEVRAYWAERNRTNFSTENVETGNITWTVQATGTIQPILKVQIGSFVSGPIVELNVDFNDKVKKGQMLAKVDPRIYKAAVDRDEAALDRAKADVERVRAQLQQAVNNYRRASELAEINAEYISANEMDRLKFAMQGNEAELKIAKLQIKQAEGQLENSMLNLEYTNILAPSDGIVIDRKIDPGQTLTAQFQTPELFVLAPDMDKRMWILAEVIEADIGHIVRAQKDERPVVFTVDAYEDELFQGKIIQVRQNPTSEQNVVTYPVVVETTNPGLKLLPGMTANLTFEIEQRDLVLKIPGSAIRYVPEARFVREEDKEILGGSKFSFDDDDEVSAEPTAEDRVEANRKRRQRHVWMTDSDNKLRAIEIEFGLSDGKFYELVEGELEDGQELVTGVEEKKRN